MGTHESEYPMPDQYTPPPDNRPSDLREAMKRLGYEDDPTQYVDLKPLLRRMGVVQPPPTQRERLPPAAKITPVAAKPAGVQRVRLTKADIKRFKAGKLEVATLPLNKNLLWAPPASLSAHDWHIACAIVIEARKAFKAKLHEMAMAAGQAAMLGEKVTFRAYRAERDYYGFKPNFGTVLSKEGRNAYRFARHKLLRDRKLMGGTVTVRTSIRGLLKVAGLHVNDAMWLPTKASIKDLAKPLHVMVAQTPQAFEPLVQAAVYDRLGVTLTVSTKWFSKPFGRVPRPLVRRSVVALRLQLLTTVFDADNDDGISSSSLARRLGIEHDRFFGRRMDAALSVLNKHSESSGIPGISYTQGDDGRIRFYR